jgi:uncharacterized protein YggE
MNLQLRPFGVRRLIVVGVAAAMLGTSVGACAVGQNLRSITQPTPTEVAPAAPPASGAPAIAPAPPVPRSGGATAGAVAAAAPAIAAAPAAYSVGQALPAVATPAPSSVRGITVTGAGHVTARPDQGTISAGVQTRGRTAQEAQNDNNQAMQSVIAAIKGIGIPDKDIQTQGVALYPMYDQGAVITGYNATNNVVVTVENVDQVGQVLDAAVQAGANQATNVRFGFKDETKLRNQALAAAATDARGKADALAGALGLQISGIESVAEGSVSMPAPLPVRALGVASAAPVPAPIEPGQLEVTAQVTIIFGY